MQPGEYLALYSADTGLTLTNAGSGVRLLDPDGKQLDATTYPKAEAGYSWTLVEGEWQWLSPSNNQDNTMASQADIVSDSDSSPGAQNEQKKDVDFAAQPESNKDEITSPSGNNVEEATENDTLNPWVLAGVGVIAVIYGLYEYRSDLRVRIQQLRRYIALRRQNRA